jgi:hypothetical protein
MSLILRRARAGDLASRRQWARACGFGAGRRVSLENQVVNEQLLAVVDAADSAGAIDDLLGEWELTRQRTAMNKAMASGCKALLPPRTPPSFPLPKGRLDYVDVCIVLDVMLSAAFPKLKRKADHDDQTIGKRVAQRLDNLRRVPSKVRERKRSKDNGSGARKGSGRARRA